MEAATAPPAPPAAAEEHVQAPPAAGSSQEAVTADSNRETGVRSYVVLEQQDLGELVEGLLGAKGVEIDEDLAQTLSGLDVLLNLGTYDSKNTEHALRQAAKQAYNESDHAEPTLIPVSETYWRPTKVTVKNERTVTFG